MHYFAKDYWKFNLLESYRNNVEEEKELERVIVYVIKGKKTLEVMKYFKE